MEIDSHIQERPDVSAEEQASHDLIKRILKLRSIEMEAEAQQMQLALQRDEPGYTLLAGPYDTD